MEKEKARELVDGWLKESMANHCTAENLCEILKTGSENGKYNDGGLLYASVMINRAVLSDVISRLLSEVL